MDWQTRILGDRIDIRTHWVFIRFPQYGIWRYLRIGKIGIRLWSVC